VAGRLSRAESERLARLAGLSGLAEFVWGSAALAQQFLGAPHPQLESRTPLEAAESEIGARQVERLLWSIEHGLPA
jgi:putative toxin-antitoxin system antitoxin component (TIGR02293 family)